MKAVSIQPPFTQLNAPYPAVWYLDAWFRSSGLDSAAQDHSIELTRRLYSRQGIQTVFAAARAALAGRRHPDKASAARVRAYLDQEEGYCRWIDGVTGYLSGQDPAFAYRLAVGAGLPMGMRTEAVLGDSGGIAPEDAPALATAMLDDLADFISYALDPHYSSVRYAERLGSGARDFREILEAADSGWVQRTLYLPYARSAFAAADSGGTTVVCLSAPFPGCLAGAVTAARAAREAFGQRALILLGGGYVSTELRFLDEPSVFGVFDALCYDAGFGSLASIMDVLGDDEWPDPAAVLRASAARLYRTRLLDSGGRVAACGFTAPEPCQAARPAGPAGGSQDAGPDREAAERAELATIHPDYSGTDFSRYLRIASSPNPMHRLWNDTPWLKYRLSYGCYWRRCAFCDTQLDYIKRYIPSNVTAIMAAADAASLKTGLYGIHFTDEAMPVRQVLEFARLNRERPRSYTFWGNIRFDRSWTGAACAEAALGGLVAVSGGIEIATAAGLEIVDKGFGLGDLIRCLASFKRHGVLVHAYLMYGFPGQSDQDIADSAETVRVLLSEGLIDSAFWHKFVLTRHSRLYADWEAGSVPGLKPRQGASRFAVNDLRFQGEASSERWTEVLDSSLAAWAEQGQLERPLSEFLAAGLPEPRVDAKSMVQRELEE